MKVLHLHRIAGIGGSERHLLELLPALRARGIDARFLGLDHVRAAPEPFYEALAERGVPFERTPCPRDFDPLLARRARRAVRAARPEIVHTHLVHADVYGALAATGTRAVLISTKHNDDPFRAGRLRLVERLVTRRATLVICITHALEGFTRSAVGLPAEKLRVVHYGLDQPPAPWGPSDGPELPDDAPVLLAVSRLVPQKGLDVAVEALPRVRERHPDARLVVLGEGPLRAELAALASRRGLADAVSLPGRVGDVAWWYRRASVVLHPARWEGFGLALLEAMLCARPVVASSVSAIPEIVVDGKTGILVPPDDPEALADAATALLAEPERARELGEAGLARARSELSVARMVDGTIAVYEEALTGTGG
ncbi:MAG TPA: glycosyltransferase family 4 protein [Gaiellaceae bacterium]|nr:glycosyltransferase family 4 protein [Gaiellaceae bacterium]